MLTTCIIPRHSPELPGRESVRQLQWGTGSYRLGRSADTSWGKDMIFSNNSTHRPRRLWAALAAPVLIVAGFGSAGVAAADTAPPSGTPPTVSADVLPTWQINGVAWAQV